MSARHVPEDWSDISRAFALKVRAHREHRQMTQEDLAEAAGISRNQVQNIEANRNNQKNSDGRPGPGNPQLDTVFALANALDVDVTYLIDHRRSVNLASASDE
ncbi:helix-turn-helix transcriptional regulator [Ammonicoccus fulvus]|uniref:Helix-turn-helix transcriptional regulator n=1 Tax=Ammonicoccus fulvus TaxID=3138240 RepID=A0ABZ3FT06_9ACTN